MKTKHNQMHSGFFRLRPENYGPLHLLKQWLLLLACFSLFALPASAYPLVGRIPTSYTILYSFGNGTNDGQQPICGLALRGDTLYGTTEAGGLVNTYNGNEGTVFSINIDGTAYHIVHNFLINDINGDPDQDGEGPAGTPLITGDEIYGTTAEGGTILTPSSQGTVYRYNIATMSYSILHTFVDTNGVSPLCQLVQVGDTLYGTASAAGTAGGGTVFKVNTNGTDFSIVHAFDTSNINDGSDPIVGLTVGETPGVLYGVAREGGSYHQGIIFRIATGLSNSYSILYTLGSSGELLSGPTSALLLDGDFLYGTCSDYNGIFRISTDGTGFTALKASGGEFNLGPLVKYGTNMLYGASVNSPSPGYLYSIETNGANYTDIHDFTGFPDASQPYCGLTLVTNNTYVAVRCCSPETNPTCECISLVQTTNAILYGTTFSGGATNVGTIFAYPLSSASSTNTINTVTITSPTNGSTFIYPASIGFTIIDTNVDSIGEVDYYAGSTHLDTETNYPYSFTWTNALPGTYTITVLSSDTNGEITAAGLVDIEVVSCTPAPANITAWWPADGNALDIVNGNDGTTNGGVAYEPGEIGMAFSLDGSSTYISVPASSSLDIGGTGTGITIEGWVSPGSITMEYTAPIIEWDSGTAIGVQFWTSDTLFANLIDTNGYNNIIASDSGVVAEGVLQHVAVTYDEASGTAVLYCNGVAVETENLGSFVPQTTYPLNIGRRTGAVIGDGYNFDGLIDELSIYNRALSATEIQTIYNAGSLGKCE